MFGTFIKKYNTEISHDTVSGSHYSLNTIWKSSYKLGTCFWTHSHFQVSSEILVWTLAGSQQPKPLLCFLTRAMCSWNKLLTQPEILRNKFNPGLHYIICIHLQGPVASKYSHSMMPLPPRFSVGVVLMRWWSVSGFSSHTSLGIVGRYFPLWFLRTEDFASPC